MYAYKRMLLKNSINNIFKNKQYIKVSKEDFNKVARDRLQTDDRRLSQSKEHKILKPFHSFLLNKE